jgi:hypothetical protein
MTHEVVTRELVPIPDGRTVGVLSCRCGWYEVVWDFRDALLTRAAIELAWQRHQGRAA